MKAGAYSASSEFKYLESFVTQDGSTEKDIRNRVTYGKIATQKLNSSL